MTKYCCPECAEHPFLNENLECHVCKGKYVWKKGEEDEN